MGKLFRFLILAAAALGLTAFGLIAATGAAKDPAVHRALGKLLDSPVYAAPGDSTPWRI